MENTSIGGKGSLYFNLLHMNCNSQCVMFSSCCPVWTHILSHSYVEGWLSTNSLVRVVTLQITWGALEACLMAAHVCGHVDACVDHAGLLTP